MLKKRMKLLLLLPAPILLSLSACALVGTAQDAAPTSDFCGLYEPVSYDSTLDTQETVAQTEKNNAKWLAVCDKVH